MPLPDLPMLIFELPLPALPMLIIELPLPDLPMLIIELPLPDLPSCPQSKEDAGTPAKESERERSAGIDTSSTRARTQLSLLRPQKIPWAPAVSAVVVAKKEMKKLDTRMVM